MGSKNLFTCLSYCLSVCLLLFELLDFAFEFASPQIAFSAASGSVALFIAGRRLAKRVAGEDKAGAELSQVAPAEIEISAQQVSSGKQQASRDKSREPVPRRGPHSGWPQDAIAINKWQPTRRRPNRQSRQSRPTCQPAAIVARRRPQARPGMSSAGQATASHFRPPFESSQVVVVVVMVAGAAVVVVFVVVVVVVVGGSHERSGR